VGLFVEKGEKLAFGALFLPSPVAANSPLRGENAHFSYFRTSGLCVICNYVLHTRVCTSSTRRILMFRTFALPKNRVEIWRDK